MSRLESASRYVDLGPELPDARGVLVVLPGQGYTPDKPLLGAAATVASSTVDGWRVRQVWWTAPRDASPTWAGTELAAAIADLGPYDGPVRVLAKSLGSLAAGAAAEAGYPACWFTPPLRRPDVVDGIAANSARQVLVGGTSDEHWDGVTARRLEALRRRGVCRMVEIAGVDHSLVARARPRRNVRAQGTALTAFTRWLRA